MTDMENGRPARFDISDDGALSRDGLSLKIPGFGIVREVGTGANGSVFLAQEQLLGRYVALKVWMKTGSAPGSRALHEVTKLSSIAHPSFAQIYRYTTVKDTPIAVMEWIEGESLKSWLATSDDYLSRVPIWTQLSAALGYLYGTGALHGDPHTGNVMLSRAPAGFSAPHLDGSLVPTPTKYKVSIIDTGTSVFWAEHSDFERREKDVLLETIDRLFGQHTLSREVVVEERLSLSDILGIGDALAIVFAAACAGPPQGSENMGDLEDEMQIVSQRLPASVAAAVDLIFLKGGRRPGLIPRLSLQRDH